MSMIAKVVFNLGVDKEFDYMIPLPMKKNIKVGTRVWVDFSGQKRVGIVTGLTSSSKREKLNSIIDVLDNIPSLSREHIRFAKGLQKDYPYAIGELIFMMLPPFLRKKIKLDLSPFPSPQKGKYEIFCIKDSSLKRRIELYQDEIRERLNYCSVIVCVPLLADVYFMEEIFTQSFPKKVVVIHSYLSKREMLTNWCKLREGKKVVLGTKVSLFYYPLDLGLIVVEEENSPYYFHQEKPYYYLLDIVHCLGRLKGVKCILSTDWPTLYTYKLIKEKKITLWEKEKENNQQKIQVFKLTSYQRAQFRNPLINELIRKNLQENKKILVLWTKKGFATVMKCFSCGYIYRCQRCSSFLRFSLQEGKGKCIWCGYEEEIPVLCKVCQQGYVKAYGVGIERVKFGLKQLFPGVEIGELEERGRNFQIMLAPTGKLNRYFIEREKIDVCFVLDADALLSHIDVDATFTLYLLLKRLALLVKDKVYVGTQSNSHYLWKVINEQWQSFYEKEMALRKELKLPPYEHLVKVTLKAKDKNRLLVKIQNLYNKIKEKRIEIFGPGEDVPFKLRDKYRYCLVVKSKNKLILRKIIKEVIEHYRSSSTKIALMLK